MLRRAKVGAVIVVSHRTWSVCFNVCIHLEVYETSKHCVIIVEEWSVREWPVLEQQPTTIQVASQGQRQRVGAYHDGAYGCSRVGREVESQRTFPPSKRSLCAAGSFHTVVALRCIVARHTNLPTCGSSDQSPPIMIPSLPLQGPWESCSFKILPLKHC